MPADGELTAFLRDTLPALHLHWPAFRRVRRQVWRRLARRLAELGLADLAAYRDHLARHPEERAAVDRCCWITVSRFARDRPVWDRLAADVLPAAATAWSAGCAGGEEPYTLAMAAPRLDILATDVDPAQLARARLGRYAPGTLRELPMPWRRDGVEPDGDHLQVRADVRARVRFVEHDLRHAAPPGPFDLVLCRNLAFSYFDEPLQRAVAASLRAALRDGGWLVVGAGENIPAGVPGLTSRGPCFYQATAT